eukprot:g10571.t1
MLNFIPRTHPSVSLLYGKRPLQRIACGSAQQHVEIPLDVTDEIVKATDSGTSYIGNKYEALPWKNFVDIKVDAANLIDSNVKSALTNLDIFQPVPAGVKEVLQEPMAKMTKQMDSLKDGSVEHISGVVHALILLSRSNLISEAELDEKLGKLLPPQAVAIVKEQAKLLPADPYMSKLEDIASKLEALTKKVEGMGAAPAGGKK